MSLSIEFYINKNLTLQLQFLSITKHAYYYYLFGSRLLVTIYLPDTISSNNSWSLTPG
jgi:hypothetical protein